MILAGKFAVGLLDLRLSRIARDAHHFVIILEFHRSPDNGNVKEYYAQKIANHKACQIIPTLQLIRHRKQQSLTKIA